MAFFCFIVAQKNWLINMNNAMNNTTFNNMNDIVTQPNLVGVQPNIRQPRKCGFCGLNGHNKRTLVGPKIQPIPHGVNTVHELSKSSGRHYCVYCALMSVKKRTRFRCCGDQCNLPLCSVGTGKSQRDCFALAHANEDIRNACVIKHKQMLSRTSRALR